jgi:hypothetical protein
VLQKAIGRWFFFTSLTGRYTSSPETVMDSDLARFRGIKTGEEFLRRLDTVIDENLTGDYWAITLPANLDRDINDREVLRGRLGASTN